MVVRGRHRSGDVGSRPGGKVGRPKTEHVERVARRLVKLFPDATPEQMQAALLHDTLEDCDTTPIRLVRDGIEPEIVELVERLTHWLGTPMAAAQLIGRSPEPTVLVIGDDGAECVDGAEGGGGRE
jgi:hypothetical protein